MGRLCEQTLEREHDGLDPLSRFLMDTLVARPTLLTRHGVPFVAIRRWRAGVKPYQIEALRQLKRNPPAQFVSAVADDILACVDSMMGGRLYGHVAPVPSTRSRPGNSLSLLLAEKLAARLDMRLITPLSAERATGSSHPKDNVRRPPMTLETPAPGPIVLVDDVISSGAHMEEATRLLLPSARAIFAVAWIGGGQS
jgi:predicted amidophosphoribosyltransferase